MDELQARIEQLKKEKNAILLAHYYVPDEVQKAADYVGDSFYLSKLAAKTDADVIVFCGVSFMGESAKILAPDKTVLLPDITADCPMAHMADVGRIEAMRRQYGDLAVVCYINSTAELKQHSDVCVTSSNALKIVKNLPNRYIYFIPDENLGRHIAGKIPDKEFIFNDGCCHVHAEITAGQVAETKKAHPDAKFLAHPECRQEVLSLADFVGSTSEIIDYACGCDAAEYIIGTETGVLFELREKNPDKQFYSTGAPQLCAGMKKITLQKIIHVMETGANAVEVTDKLREAANAPLTRMLQLAGQPD